MVYDDVVRNICGDNWMTLGDNERDGGYGIAIILAYLQGCKPDLGEFSRHLRVHGGIIANAYKRLQVNGLFSNNSWIFTDPLLVGNHDGSAESEMRSRRAWCWIAGLASGFVGKG